MKILLDTTALLWALSDSPKLPREARELILDNKNEIYYSAASLLEIKLKKFAQKLTFSASDIEKYCKKAGYHCLSLAADEITHFSSDKNISDCFYGILVAQACKDKMKLLSFRKKSW